MDQRYDMLSRQFAGLIDGERDFLANIANLSALLYQELDELNWAGCYLLRGGDLVLGPFQGRPACTRIAVGQGVCGTAAERRETVVVNDVHAFPGHIACDAASNAEIVVPLLAANVLYGVLDLDSPRFGRFTDSDCQGLENLVALLVEQSDLPLV